MGGLFTGLCCCLHNDDDDNDDDDDDNNNNSNNKNDSNYYSSPIFLQQFNEWLIHWLILLLTQSAGSAQFFLSHGLGSVLTFNLPIHSISFTLR